MALVMTLDGEKVFTTEHLGEMRNEVCVRAYGVAKARTAEKMYIINEDTGEVVYEFSCDDPDPTTSTWVQGFMEAFAPE